ncbi:MAG: extracellular solute-binding protein [Clostridia bacterium]|nr:extracellular solute-binding protein [Clostridia bacterium]
MKKIFSVLLACMLAFSMCAALAEEASLKLTDEPVEFSVWFPFPAEDFGAMSTLNDADVYKWMEEQTNVHINWIIPATGAESENFNLLFAADEMPDIVFNQGGKYEYVEGAEAAVEDGYYLALNDLIDEYAPNYKAVLESDENIAKDAATDSGLIWSFYFIYSGGGKGMNCGPIIRKDFLDACGLDVPTTYDELHTALVAFKEQLGIPSPLYLNIYGSGWHDEYMSGYGVAQGFYQEDGQVKYGPIEDGYGEYLDMMRDWFEEGLIYKDFAIGTEEEPSEDLVLNDEIGCWVGYATHAGDTYYPTRGAVNPDFNLVGMKIPGINADDVNHLRMIDTVVNTYSWAITADCEHPEIAVQWLDIFYNPEYFNLFNYGMREGESYVIDENGQYHWGDLIMHNPDGLTVNQARCTYTMLNPFYEEYSRVMGSWNEDQLAAQNLWRETEQDWVISSKLSPTADESRKMSEIMTDITTLVREETVKYIMGTSTYTFDALRDQIKGMGIEDAIAIEQVVLDRYNAR